MAEITLLDIFDKIAKLQMQLDPLVKSNSDNAVEHAQIISHLESIDESMIQICSITAKHSTTLYGNGKDGLTTIVKLLVENQSRINKFLYGLLSGFGLLLAQSLWEIISK